MCGIAGKLHLREPGRAAESEIDAMLQPIRHRGPDGGGIFLDGPAGLGHLRLSIIDLSTGDQPMSNEDETVWIVFNGEIYNYASLRERLLASGHTFRSRSDTETIIHLYEEFGDDCVRHLRGMFAFAIWDMRRQRLLLARDRVGIKPLYYCRTPSALLFGSELKAILADPSAPREIDLVALREFLSFYYLPGERTMFGSVRRLPPGHTLTVEGGQVAIHRYWDLQFSDSRHQTPFEDVVAELYDLLAGAVRDHMIADVPVGVLLSGGVDSSAVLSLAVERTGKQVKTFTVGFDDPLVVDERPYARMAARRFGTDHHEISISVEDFWGFLPDYVWHMEEPVCEPPAVALYYLTRLAREHVKVVLSGEGGDEAFGGYPNYPNMIRLFRVKSGLGRLAPIAGAAAGAAARAFGAARLDRYAHALGHPLADSYFSRTSSPATYFNRHLSALTTEFSNASSEASPARAMRDVLRPVVTGTLLNQMLYVDSKTWLPDDLLLKADKITMANSQELRVPLLDHVLLEFAATLPDAFKVRGHETKLALKAAFAKALPAEILTRKKAGFPVPFSGWMRHALAGRIRELLLSDSAVGRRIFEPAAVDRLLVNHVRTGAYSKEVFAMVVVELWHRRFVDMGTATDRPISCPRQILRLPAGGALAGRSA